MTVHCVCRKEGATEVRNHGEAEQVLQAAAAAAQAIHGLGPGGNVPHDPKSAQGMLSEQLTACVHSSCWECDLSLRHSCAKDGSHVRHTHTQYL